MEFKYDIRDLKFILKEWLPSQDVAACDRFKDTFSMEDVDMLMTEGYKVAREVINPINAPGDKIGVKFENGKSTPTPGFKEAYQFLQQNGWASSSECIMVDTGMPLIMYKALFEVNCAACTALMSAVKLTSGVANLILRFGTEKDRAMFLPKMFSGEWQGTMCITEPNFGSDAGDMISKSFPTDDPRIYKIKGTKMFITCGDQGHCENTIHMVLARPPKAASGSPGIGLYIVPKIWVNDDGTLGRDNDVTTVGIEHKMGLSAQATALLSFGDNDQCYGILVGNPPDEKGVSKGLSMMFHMMNESRIGTGHNSNTQAAAAYYYASRYATERIQGRPFGIRNADRVPIIKHEDIRRMLLDMKAHVEGIRAMTFRGFYNLDIQANSSDKAKAKTCGEFAEILTPLVKGYGSEMSLGVIAQAMQVLGGVGYTREYPIEQLMRDSKILTIWEGTTFIHAQDLINRKMRMDGGKPFRAWMATIKEFIDKNLNAEGFAKEMAKLAKAYQCMEEVLNIYNGWYNKMEAKRELIPLYAVKAMFVVAQVQVAECLMSQALIANSKIGAADATDKVYYEGKVAAARYYVNNVLPNVYLSTEMIREEDDTVLRCAEESLVV